MKEKILLILKSYEQHDYKNGGTSIAPEMYNAIADKIEHLISREALDVMICPIVPNETRVIEKSKEFENSIGINKFAAGAMWMKLMLIGK